MPSPDWLIKNFHHRWYPDETLDVSIGQGAVEATPIQLARIIGGIASGGHLVRPHVVFPNELPADFYKSLQDSFPGTGDAYIPIDPANWEIITNGMYEVTQPGLYHTAGADGLPGIDFGGKTGTAQQMSHEALEKTNKGRATFPNVWFVGVTPRRNPELVVAVLWQDGEFSYYPARIGARVVEAYVNKKRREAGNLPPEKAAAPVDVGAVWTEPDSGAGQENSASAEDPQRAFLCRWKRGSGGKSSPCAVDSETREKPGCTGGEQPRCAARGKRQRKTCRVGSSTARTQARTEERFE